MPDIKKVGHHIHMPKRDLATYKGQYKGYLTGAGHTKRERPMSALGNQLLPRETVFLVIPPGQRPIRVTPT